MTHFSCFIWPDQSLRSTAFSGSFFGWRRIERPQAVCSHIAKCSADTALRNINELLIYGALRKADAGGRSTNYELDTTTQQDNSTLPDITQGMKAR
jgi:hypothetical protein